MIYLIHAEGTDRYKIGYTSGDPSLRLRSIQTSSAYALAIIGQQDGTLQDERKIHRRLYKYRVQGEWFCFPCKATALAMFTKSRTPEQKAHLAERQKASKIKRKANKIMSEYFTTMGITPRVLGMTKFEVDDRPNVFSVLAKVCVEEDAEVDIRELKRFMADRAAERINSVS